MFTKRFDRRVRLAAAVLAGSLLFGASFAVYALWPSRQAIGYEPEQPFTFPHKIMAGDARIPCRYCHASVEIGPHAGMPTVQTCMNCHSQVRPKDKAGNLKPDIATLLTYVEPGTNRPLRPIVWQKVHDLSDFAYFDHSRHVVGGRVECAECHGPVESMTRIRRVHSLKMGWCLECHRKPPEGWRTDGRPTRGPTHCSTCHR
jgi:hypothetical protein